MISPLHLLRRKNGRSSRASTHGRRGQGWFVVFLAASVFLCIGLGGGYGAQAQSGIKASTTVYVFWSRSCPHCKRALTFLGRFAASTPRLRLRTYEVDESQANLGLFEKVNSLFFISRPAVPTIVIGGRVFVGYGDDSTTGKILAAEIRDCLEQSCSDPVAAFLPSAGPKKTDGPSAILGPRRTKIERPGLPSSIDIPFIGRVKTADLSLPLLTVAMAAIDGFNPCAMWALIFLIGLLLGLNNRRRMWLLGGVFIGASALVYFAILSAWLNVLLFLGALVWIRVAVALVAIGGGGYYLREFARGEVACKVTSAPSRRRTLDRLKALATGRHLFTAVVGIALLAVAVNMIDLLCSAGLPAVYTEVLTQSQLTGWQYHGYLLLYVLVFMADDLLIFFVAMTTLKLGHLSLGFARYSNLIGGVLLLAIGGLLLFRPEWLSFG